MANNEELQAQYKQIEDYKANVGNLATDTSDTGDKYDRNKQGFGDFGASGWGGTAAQSGVAVTDELGQKLRRLESLMNQLDSQSGEVLNQLGEADKRAEADIDEVVN